jgi:hypothetical protein
MLAFLLATTAVSFGTQCPAEILNNTGLGEKAYKIINNTNLDDCCHACAADTKVSQLL